MTTALRSNVEAALGAPVDELQVSARMSVFLAEQLHIPPDLAGEVMKYLRALMYVETVAETRNCKREPGKHGATRIFIKVVAIHPEPPLKAKPAKLNVLRSKLVHLSKAMPAPRRSH